MMTPLAALLALAAVAPMGGATTIATSPKPTTVSAYAAIVVWSSYVPSTRRYRLTARVGARIRVLPVASRGVPFDVDLGPDGHGGVVAAYSRCRREPDYVLPDGSLPQPTYSRGVGCDIYRNDFAKGRETKVAAVSRRDASEYMPSIWKNSIAFARVTERRRGRAGVVSRIYVQRLSPVGPPLGVPAGPWGDFDLTGRFALPQGAGGAGAMAMDLSGSHLAFAWEYWKDLVQNALLGPTLVGDSLVYGEFQPDLNPGSFVVRTAAGGTSFEYAPVDGPLVSQATTESATFTVRHKVGGYEIDEYSNLPYSAGLPALP